LKSNGVPQHLARPTAASISGMGMWLLLASLSVLFFASLIGYAVIRVTKDPPPLDLGPATPGLWVSTILLILSSLTLHGALASARRDSQGGVRAFMGLTLLLGLGFLVNQFLNWRELVALGIRPVGTGAASFNAVSFYFLTGLHAAHVLGGVLPLLPITAAAWRGYYSRANHLGLRMFGMYWHFLDIVWLILFAVLLTTAA
jgi:cytochrome c oxidase subunit III